MGYEMNTGTAGNESKFRQYFFGSQILKDKPPLRETARMPYEIVVLCLTDAVDNMVAIVQSQLVELSTVSNHVVLQTSAGETFARITVKLTCSTAERAVLVRLVMRLGLEKVVRSVSWTGLAI